MKHKEKRKHLESTDSKETIKTPPKKLKLEYDLQCSHKGMATAQDDKAWETSSSSPEYFSCISSEDELIGTGIANVCKCTSQSGCHFHDTTVVHEERDTSSVSEYYSCDSSLHMSSCAGPSQIQKGVTQLGHIAHKIRERVPGSEYLSSIFTDKKTGLSDLVEEIPQAGPSGLCQGKSQVAEKDSNSKDFSCTSSEDKLTHTDFWKFQEHILQAGPCIVASSSTQTTEGDCSSSDYVTCCTSAYKITVDDGDGLQQLPQDGPCLGSSEMPQPQDSEQEETSSAFPYISFPFRPVCKTGTPSEHGTKKERVMKIYYMNVQMKRGVADLWDTEEGVEPPPKKTRMEEITFPEKSPTGVTHSFVPTRELLSESESRLEVETQEEIEESDTAELPVPEENSRAKTPDWLVALDSGFRCMGCCRVFPSLEALQEHVRHGISEGFSCQAFHLALAWLKGKRNRKGKKREKKKKISKRTPRSNQKKNLGMRTSSC